MTTVAKRVKAANESAKSLKEREKKYHCKKLVGIRMAQSKEIQVEGEHSIIFANTLFIWTLLGLTSQW